MNESPNYPWYQLGQMDDLQQGDLLFECPIINISGNSFDKLNEGAVTDIEVSVERLNLIIMTQSCDLANHNTEQVLLCGLTPSTSYGKNMDNIRTNKMPALCLIESSDINLPNFERQVIDFREVYNLPKSYVLELVKDETRARLLPPYKEYVAQAFARFFMRIGLPEDL